MKNNINTELTRQQTSTWTSIFISISIGYYHKRRVICLVEFQHLFGILPAPNTTTVGTGIGRETIRNLESASFVVIKANQSSAIYSRIARGLAGSFHAAAPKRGWTTNNIWTSSTRANTTQRCRDCQTHDQSWEIYIKETPARVNALPFVPQHAWDSHGSLLEESLKSNVATTNTNTNTNDEGRKYNWKPINCYRPSLTTYWVSTGMRTCAVMVAKTVPVGTSRRFVGTNSCPDDSNAFFWGGCGFSQKNINIVPTISEHRRVLQIRTLFFPADTGLRYWSPCPPHRSGTGVFIHEDDGGSPPTIFLRTCLPPPMVVIKSIDPKYGGAGGQAKNWAIEIRNQF